MSVTPEIIRFILAFKVRNLRQQRGTSVTELAQRAGMSVSYLSEIENGRKFPKADKLIQLAKALGVGYEELVSPLMQDEPDGVTAFFRSELIKEFPFDLFGMEAGDLLGLIPPNPAKASAFVETLFEIGQTHDVQMDRSLFTALCSYQRLNSNYFGDLEDAAAAYRRERGWGPHQVLEEELRDVLEVEHGYVIEEEAFRTIDLLAKRRAIYIGGNRPRLLVNPRLSRPQRTFVFARELAFRTLDLPREQTEAWPAIRTESFDQLLTSFKASYFAGCLLIDGDEFALALERFLDQESWDPRSFLDLMSAFHVTSAMIAHRMTEILPGKLGLKKLYFMRFHHRLGSDRYEMRKLLNMTGMPVPRAVGSSEHYCQRWTTTRLLQKYDGQRSWGTMPPTYPLISAQRAYFVPDNVGFFVISAAQPVETDDQSTSCVTLGFLMDDTFRERVRFWDDPSVRSQKVGLTCERCPLTFEECEARRARPLILEREQREQREREVLEQLASGGPVPS